MEIYFFEEINRLVVQLKERPAFVTIYSGSADSAACPLHHARLSWLRKKKTIDILRAVAEHWEKQCAVSSGISQAISSADQFLLIRSKSIYGRLKMKRHIERFRK